LLCFSCINDIIFILNRSIVIGWNVVFCYFSNGVNLFTHLVAHLPDKLGGLAAENNLYPVLLIVKLSFLCYNSNYVAVIVIGKKL